VIAYTTLSNTTDRIAFIHSKKRTLNRLCSVGPYWPGADCTVIAFYIQTVIMRQPLSSIRPYNGHMCHGVLFNHNGRKTRVLYTNPHAVLPVRTKSGTTRLLPWGRHADQEGELPFGGWVLHDAIRAGQWDAWSPRPVLIDSRIFAEEDKAGRVHWFPLVKSSWVQGVIATHDNERRVYVITIKPTLDPWDYSRWPRIVIHLDNNSFH
jgi:hypothetical protein